MALYEVVREIENSCARNQMRDVFFDEVEIDDPAAYVNGLLKEDHGELNIERIDDDNITIFVECSGLQQKFLFTRI